MKTTRFDQIAGQFLDEDEYSIEPINWGQHSETAKIETASKDYFAKIPTTDHEAFSSAKEIAVYHLLGENGIRTPEVVGYDFEGELFGFPFYATEHIEGENPGGSMESKTPEEQVNFARKVGENLANIHNVAEKDPRLQFERAGPLTSSDGEQLEPASDMTWQTFIRKLSDSMISDLRGTMFDRQDLLSRTQNYLREGISEIEESDLIYNHFDFTLDNYLLGDEEIIFIDPAMAIAGDRAYDKAKAQAYVEAPLEEGIREEGGTAFDEAYRQTYKGEHSYEHEELYRVLSHVEGGLSLLELEEDGEDIDESALEHSYSEITKSSR